MTKNLFFFVFILILSSCEKKIINWSSWNDQTFQLSKKTNKPIFAFFGYSLCKECNQVEQQINQDEDIIQILNQNFIPIKVDKQKNPEIDKFYKFASQYFVSHDDQFYWLIISPTKNLLWGGTYSSQDEFITKLKNANEEWKKQSIVLQKNGKQKTQEFFKDLLQKNTIFFENEDKPYLQQYSKEVVKIFDPLFGGFENEIKWPPCADLKSMMQFTQIDQNDFKTFIPLIEKTLISMYKGEIYDHIGGGFHLYANKPNWDDPQFEKRLYLNSLLSQIYLEAYQITHKVLYKHISQEILQYLSRNLLSPTGGFYSIQNSFSDQNKNFYSWNQNELKKFLSEKEFSLISQYLHDSHFFGLNFINDQDLNLLFSKPIKKIKSKILDKRYKKPTSLLTDKKIITSWNGIALSAFSKAYQAFQIQEYKDIAINLASFLKNKLWTGKELLRIYSKGETTQAGLLNDYVFLTEGLINLYETDFNPSWIQWALQLQNILIQDFWSIEMNGFYYTKKKNNQLPFPYIEFQDSVLPSSNAIALHNLIKLYSLTSKNDYLRYIEKLVKSYSFRIQKEPLHYSTGLMAYNFYDSGPIKIAFVGKIEDELIQKNLDYLHRSYHPMQILAFKGLKDKKTIPFLQNKVQKDQKGTLYLCQFKKCNTWTNLDEYKKIEKSFFKIKAGI